MMYGDQQSQFTMNRAAYGDGPATMMIGGGYGGGGYQTDMNAMSSIGAHIRPVFYSPPARVNVGFYGMQQQNPTFWNGVGNMLGVSSVPRSAYTSEYTANASGDFGARIGGGLVGAGLSAAGSLGGMYAGNLLGSGLVGIVGGIGLSMGGMAVANYVQQTIAQRQEMQNFLEQTSYRYISPGSGMADPRMGGGFSRAARREITDYIRRQETSDPFLDFNDMSNILKQSTAQGLFNGTGSMEEFKTKFRDITDAVKVVTKTLHQTLEEGVRTIKELKSIGIDPSQAKSIMAGVDTYAKMSGKTGAEMLGLGLQGADLFRGTGINMGIGFQATMMNNAAIRAARDAGTLSNEAIMQAGGEESLAMKMTAGSLATAQSAMGRGFYAAFAGKGGMEAFTNNMLAGGGNFIDTVAKAAGNLGTPAKLLEYQAFQAKHLSDLGKAFGGQGLQVGEMGLAAGLGTYMAGMTGASNEAGFRAVLLQMGKSESEIEAMIGRLKNTKGEYRSANASALQTLDKNLIEEAEQNAIWNRAWSKTKDYINRGVDVIARPANEMIGSFEEGATRWMEKNIYGYDRVDVTKYSGLKFAPNQAGLKRKGTSLDDFSENGTTSLLAAAVIGGVAGIGLRSMFGRATSDAFTVSAGEALLRKLENKAVNETLGVDVLSKPDSYKLSSDDIVLNQIIGGNRQIVSRSQLLKASERAGELLTAYNNADELKKKGALKDVSLVSLAQIAAEGKYSDIGVNSETFLKATTGLTDLKQMTPSMLAAVTAEYKGTKFENLISDYAKNLSAPSAASRVSSQADALVAMSTMRETEDKLIDATKSRTGNAVMGFSRTGGISEITPQLRQALVSKDKDKIIEALGREQGISGSRAISMAGKLLENKDIEDWISSQKTIQDANQDYMNTVVTTGAVKEAIKSGLSNSEIESVRSDAASIQSIIAKNPKDIGDAMKGVSKSFINTEYGKRISKFADLVQDLNKLDSKSGVSEWRKVLSNNGIDSELSSNILSQQGVTKDIVIKSIADSLNKSGNGINGAVTVGGTGLENTQGSAIQNFETQLRINQQILNAMEAIATKLHVSK